MDGFKVGKERKRETPDTTTGRKARRITNTEGMTWLEKAEYLQGNVYLWNKFIEQSGHTSQSH